MGKHIKNMKIDMKLGKAHNKKEIRNKRILRMQRMKKKKNFLDNVKGLNHFQ